MSEEIEDVWVVCSDWSEAELRLLDGNRTTSCGTCNAPLVISTEGRALIAKQPLVTKPICFTCAIARDPDVVPGLAPGALEHVERAGYRLTASAREGIRTTPLKGYRGSHGQR
jgi:hypothetical protein